MTRDYLPELLAISAVPINASVHRANLRKQLEELDEELLVWQYLNGKWGHVNALIDAVNLLHRDLGDQIRIEKGLL